MLSNLTETSWINNDYTVPNGKNQNYDWNTYVKPYIKIAKDCGTTGVNCFAGVGGGWYNPNGKPYDNNNNGYGTNTFNKVILKNGMSLAFRSCNTCYDTHRLFVIDIDGPQKGYSRSGSDIFVFEWVNPENVPSDANGKCRGYPSTKPSAPTLVPFEEACWSSTEGGWYWGYSDKITEIKNNCIGDLAGWRQSQSYFQGVGKTCAAWIIRNGWKFPDDYPFAKMSERPANFVRPKAN